MLRNPCDNKDEIKVHYHRNPQRSKTFGHISIESFYKGEKRTLNINPDTSSTQPLTMLTDQTNGLFPSRANNTSINLSDIKTSYDITKNIPDHKSAHEKIDELSKNIKSGRTGYSILPNIFNSALYTLLSRDTSAVQLMVGVATFDREKISSQTNHNLTNCASSLNQVLIAGGHPRIGWRFFPLTPSTINKYFQDRLQYKKEAETDNSSKRIKY